MTTNRKFTSVKSKFVLFQTSPILIQFHLVSNVGEIFWIEPEKDRHVQKSVMQMQSCCFFAVLVAVAVAVALAPFSCDPKILLPW